MNEKYLTGIVKTDISDHFPVFLVTDTKVNKTEKSRFVFKREIIGDNIKIFKEKLQSVNWTSVLNNIEPNSAFNDFLEIFLLHYNTIFPMRRIQIKTKNLENSWITRGIIKSSKKNQKLYEKYLKRYDSKKRRYL